MVDGRVGVVEMLGFLGIDQWWWGRIGAEEKGRYVGRCLVDGGVGVGEVFWLGGDVGFW